MNAQFRKALKSVAFLTDDRKVRGEAVISEKGLNATVFMRLLVIYVKITIERYNSFRLIRYRGYGMVW